MRIFVLGSGHGAARWRSGCAGRDFNSMPRHAESKANRRPKHACASHVMDSQTQPDKP